VGRKNLDLRSGLELQENGGKNMVPPLYGKDKYRCVAV